MAPVVITEHNRPSFVLMTYAEYQRLHNAPADLSEWLRMDTEADFEIEIGTLRSGEVRG